MLQLGPVFLEVGDHRQDVDDEESGYGSNVAQDTAYLRVEDRDQGGDGEDDDVDTVEYLICDLLVSKEELEAKGP